MGDLPQWTRREFGRTATLAGVAGALSTALPSRALSKKDKQPKGSESRTVSGVDSLRAHASAVGLLTGCAVVPERLDLSPGTADPYTRTVIEQSSILVAENSMKWASMRPSPTTFEFSAADMLFDFAGRNGQLVRGHNLCWHEQLPSWFQTTATRQNARDLLTQHIQAVAGRYAGRVHSWDVVNEAVHVPDGRADGLRKTSWLDLIGSGYIELAFTTAAKADPRAKLTYNDFDIELDTPEQSAKRAQVLMLVRRLHARGIPIHAIGIQSHLQATGPRSGAGVVSLIRSAAEMGLEVYITEIDVNTHSLPGGPELQDTAVADVYRGYLDLLLREPNVKALLTWGITDRFTWLNQIKQAWTQRADGARQRPLPFDDDYAPTPAFFAMRDAYDTARASVTPADIMTPNGASAKPSEKPFAPFAVPGSPGTPPLAPVASPQR